MNQTIKTFLVRHADKKTASFHMPGHKGSALYREFGHGDFLDRIMDCDITEIPGADNLFQAEGIIDELQQRYARLYEVDRSYLLINGTSTGIIASILASVPKGKKLIMARNCHKSVFNALTLADAEPVYAHPTFMEAYGISGEITAAEIERLLIENEDAAAVILPSPNYYGICSDIEKIAKVVHAHHKILIVDQAHGAHLKFFRKYGIDTFPKSAEEAGADIVINSIHKTLASYTQSAVLNLNSSRVSPEAIADKLQCIESTSPSYILMGSLDINASLLEDHGQELMRRWADNLDYFYQELSKNPYVSCFERIPSLDHTKVNFSLPNLRLTGSALEEILNETYHVFIELYTGKYVMAMTGIGNQRKHYQMLADALSEITAHALKRGLVETPVEQEVKMAYSPKRAELYPVPKDRKYVDLMDAEGCVCANSLIPYPPGIPLVCPGEKIEKEVIAYIRQLRERGEKVIGISSENKILVG